MEEMYAQVPQEEENPYGFGDETIYDSICYYQRPVSDLVGAVSINMLWVWHIKMQGVWYVVDVVDQYVVGSVGMYGVCVCVCVQWVWHLCF